MFSNRKGQLELDPFFLIIIAGVAAFAFFSGNDEPSQPVSPSPPPASDPPPVPAPPPPAPAPPPVPAPVDGSEDPPPIQEFGWEYPEDRKSGYYAVPTSYCPADRCGECGREDPNPGSCGAITDPRGLYLINDGYEEDFTFTSDIPIYGAWEIRNFDDFSNKCFVGDCNLLNSRIVACIDENGIASSELLSCNKWQMDGVDVNSASKWCVEGQSYPIRQDGRQTSGMCRQFASINYYYAYNEWPGYEGYDPSWRDRWQVMHDKTQQLLSQYGVVLVPSFYEYKLENDSTLPGALYNTLDNTAVFRPADIHVSIFAGTQWPGAYGVPCGPYPTLDGQTVNPCSMNSGIRAGDYRAVGDQNIKWRSLAHEIGHVSGCPHTGDKGSLASHLYAGDIMSYGTDFGDFIYECRIAMWYFGRNG